MEYSSTQLQRSGKEVLDKALSSTVIITRGKDKFILRAYSEQDLLKVLTKRLDEHEQVIAQVRKRLAVSDYSA